MKLTSVFLLFLFSCVVFSVGPVSTISAEEDHDAEVEGPYAAEAHAYRKGGLKHVTLHAKGTSTERGKNGYFDFRHYRVFVPNRLNLLESKDGGPIDGSFHEELDRTYKNEPRKCIVISDVWGNDSYGNFCDPTAIASVGPMPPPPIPVPPPDDAAAADDDPEPGIYPIDPSDTPSPGERHGYILITAEPYYWVDWYVKAPWDTSERGEYIEGDNGDGTATEATMYYTYPSGAMHTGDFLITAVIYRWSDMSQYEETYTATVVLE